MGKHTPLVHFLPSQSARTINGSGGEGFSDRMEGATAATGRGWTTSPSSQPSERPPSSSHLTPGPNRMAAESSSSKNFKMMKKQKTNTVDIAMSQTAWTHTSGVEVQRSPTDWSKSSGSASTAWSSSSSKNDSSTSSSRSTHGGGGEDTVNGGNTVNDSEPPSSTSTGANNMDHTDAPTSTPKKTSINSQKLVSRLVAQWNKKHPKDMPNDDVVTNNDKNESSAFEPQPPQVTVFLRKSVEELEVTPKEGDAERILLGTDHPETALSTPDVVELAKQSEKPLDVDGDHNNALASKEVDEPTKYVKIQDGTTDIELLCRDPSLVHTLFVQKEAPPPPEASSKRCKTKKAMFVMVPKTSILKKKKTVPTHTAVAPIPSTTNNVGAPPIPANDKTKESIVPDHAAIEVSHQASIVTSMAVPPTTFSSSSKNIQVDSSLDNSIELTRERTSLEELELGTPAAAALTSMDDVATVPSDAIFLANASPTVSVTNDDLNKSNKQTNLTAEQQSEVHTPAAASTSVKRAFKVWSKKVLPGRNRAGKSRYSDQVVNIQPADDGSVVEVSEVGTLLDAAPKTTVPAAEILTKKERMAVSSDDASQEADNVLQIANDAIEVAQQPSAKITAIEDSGNVYHETFDVKGSAVDKNDGRKVESLPPSMGAQTPSHSFRIVGSTSPVSSFDNGDKVVAKKEGAVSWQKKTIAPAFQNQTKDVVVTRAPSVRTTASSSTVVQKTSARTNAKATKPFVSPVSMREEDASSLSLSFDAIGSRTRVRTAKLQAIRPSLRDTPFIRPQHLLVTDDTTANTIEIMRHPSLVVHTTIQEVSDNSTPMLLDKPIANDDPIAMNLPAKMATSSDEVNTFLSQKDGYTVHVNVLGVAGIVVDRLACSDVKLNEHQAPSTPSQMKAVVGISMHGGNIVEDVTTLSEGLILSPSNPKATMLEANDGTQEAFELHSRQRLVAVWAVDKKTKRVGSSISTVLSDFQKGDKTGPFSHYLPVTMDLTIALTDVDESSLNRHVAVPIGVAQLVLSSETIRHGDMVSLDVPVVPFEGSEHTFIEVERKGQFKLGRGIKQFFQRYPQDLPHGLTNEEQDPVRSIFGIDNNGDSMVRIEVRVEKTKADTKRPAFGKNKSNKSLTRGRDVKIHESGSVETEETTYGSTGGSLLSGITTKGSTSADYTSIQQVPSFGTLDSKTLKVLMCQQDQHEPVSDDDNIAKRYSSPLVFQQVIAKNDFDAVSVNNNMDNAPGSTSADKFGTNFFTCSACAPLTSPASNIKIPEAALRLDDEIEEVADKMFGSNFPFVSRSYAATGEFASKKTEEVTTSTTDDKPLRHAVPQADSGVINPMYKADAMFYNDSVALQKEKEDDDSLTLQSYSVLSQYGVEGSSDSPSRTDTDQSIKNFSGRLNDAQEDVKQLFSDTAEAVKDYVTEKFGKWATEKAESFFPTLDPDTQKGTTLLDENASMGDATLEAFVNGQLRMRSMGDASKTSAASTGDPTYSTSLSNPTNASLMPTEEGSKVDGSRTGPPTTTEDKEDTMSPPDSLAEAVPGKLAHLIQPLVETEVEFPSSLEAEPLFEERSASFDATPTVDTPFSNTQDATRTTRTLDETLERTVSTFDGETTRNDDTYDGAEADDDEEAAETQSNDTGSPHSVVEAIAEAISQYASCGGGVNTSIVKGKSNATKSSATTSQSRHAVPRTVDPLATDELHSVGELTATTLEKKLEHAARQAQAAGTKFFSTSRFSCGNLAVVEEDYGVPIINNRHHDALIRLQTPMELAPTSTYSTLGVSVMDDDQEEEGDRPMLVTPLDNNMVMEISGGPTSVPVENYFAEYEDVGLPRPHSRIQYLEMEQQKFVNDPEEEDAPAVAVDVVPTPHHVPVDDRFIVNGTTITDRQLPGEEC